MRRTWLGLVALALAACASAPGIDDVRAAQYRGDHETALRLARDLAARGHSGVHYLIGIAYAKGEGVAQDFDEADRWFARFVEMRKGKRYLTFSENSEEAVASFYDIAYTRPMGQALNSERAVIWYERSAAAGSARALRRLGHLHMQGRGAAKDAAKALVFYRRAAAAGDASSHYYTGKLYLSGELGAPDPKRAREAFVEGVENGDYFSAEALGRMHLDGVGGEKNPQLARGWWIVAVKLGNLGSATNVARLYLKRIIPADDWRIRGLSWSFVGWSEGGLFSERRHANFYSTNLNIARFTDEEIRSARRLARTLKDKLTRRRRGARSSAAD